MKVVGCDGTDLGSNLGCRLLNTGGRLGLPHAGPEDRAVLAKPDRGITVSESQCL